MTCHEENSHTANTSLHSVQTKGLRSIFDVFANDKLKILCIINIRGQYISNLSVAARKEGHFTNCEYWQINTLNAASNGSRAEKKYLYILYMKNIP